MGQIQDFLIGHGRRGLGVGASIDPTDIADLIPVSYTSFLGGVNTVDSLENIAPNEAPLIAGFI